VLEVIHDKSSVSYDVVETVSTVADRLGDLDYIEVSVGMQLAFVDAGCTLVGRHRSLFRPSYQT
jgi:hypothetical protein